MDWLREHYSGEETEYTTACQKKGCRGQILWARTEAHRMMPLDAQMIRRDELWKGMAGWAVRWGEDRRGRRARFVAKAVPELPWVYETHFVTCPGVVSPEDAQQRAERHSWFRRLWRGNGGTLEGEAQQQLVDDAWLNQDWTGGV